MGLVMFVVRAWRSTRGMVAMTNCLIPDCVRPAKARGLCGACYAAASREIKAGRTTWVALIKKGFCLADIRRHGTSIFRVALEKGKER
jgi:hypothetical protein